MAKHLKSRTRKIWRRLLIILGAAAVAILIFLGVFYVPDDNFDVSGNTRYTASEIREMVATDFMHHNAIYLSKIVKTVVPDDVPFVTSIDIEYTAHNRISLHVNENNPIGYICQDDNDYYFDSEGYVLEVFPSSMEDDSNVYSVTSSSESVQSVSSSSEDTAASATEDSAASSTTDSAVTSSSAENTSETSAGDTSGTSSGDTSGTSSGDTTGTSSGDTSGTSAGSTSGTSAGDTTGTSAGDTSGTSAGDASGDGTSDGTVSTDSALEADMIRSQDTEFHPALTDVTEVTGLTDEKLSVGMTIQAEDPSVFSSLLALTKIISKLDILPNSIEVTNGNEFILHYGDIRIMLGTDDNLEDKMSRLAAILPKLSGLKGVLHLEDLSEDTVNIIFDKDTDETDSTSTSEDTSETDSTTAEDTSTSDGTTSSGTTDTGSDNTSDVAASDTGAVDGTDTTDSTAADGTDTAGTDTSGTDSTTGGDTESSTADGTGQDSGTDNSYQEETTDSGTDTSTDGENGGSSGTDSYGGYLY